MGKRHYAQRPKKPKKSRDEIYKDCLLRFLLFAFPNEHLDAASLSQELLLQITPKHIVEYFNFRAYGVREPTEDDRPTQARSSTLMYTKKALSKFMPRKHQTWDYIRAEGNPTRSEDVNQMIDQVKKFEVRKEGVPPSAVRPLEFGEFVNLLKLARRDLSSSRFLMFALALCNGKLSVAWTT